MRAYHVLRMSGLLVFAIVALVAPASATANENERPAGLAIEGHPLADMNGVYSAAAPSGLSFIRARASAKREASRPNIST